MIILQRVCSRVYLLVYDMQFVNLGYDVLAQSAQSLAQNDSTLRRIDLKNTSPLFLFITSSLFAALLGAALIMPVIQYTTLYRAYVGERKDFGA